MDDIVPLTIYDYATGKAHPVLWRPATYEVDVVDGLAPSTLMWLLDVLRTLDEAPDA